jgi:hypothetical protein
MAQVMAERQQAGGFLLFSGVRVRPERRDGTLLPDF